jgi:hypothetical protein
MAKLTKIMPNAMGMIMTGKISPAIPQKNSEINCFIFFIYLVFLVFVVGRIYDFTLESQWMGKVIGNWESGIGN